MTKNKTVTLWQIGRDNSPEKIAPQAGNWLAEYNYTVEIDRDPIHHPSIPQLLAIPSVSTTEQECLATGKLNIYFSLNRNYQTNELKLFYGCFGKQENRFLLDGQALSSLQVQSESEELQQIEITLPEMTVGDHILTIKVTGEQQNLDYQVISYLKLEVLKPETLKREKVKLLPIPDNWATWIADKAQLNIWNQLW